MALSEAGITKDNVVSKLEEMAKEFESLRNQLIASRERVHYLEERINAVYQTVFQPTENKPSSPRY